MEEEALASRSDKLPQKLQINLQISFNVSVSKCESDGFALTRCSPASNVCLLKDGFVLEEVGVEETQFRCGKEY